MGERTYQEDSEVQEVDDHGQVVEAVETLVPLVESLGLAVVFLRFHRLRQAVEVIIFDYFFKVYRFFCLVSFIYICFLLLGGTGAERNHNPTLTNSLTLSATSLYAVVSTLGGIMAADLGLTSTHANTGQIRGYI